MAALYMIASDSTCSCYISRRVAVIHSRSFSHTLMASGFLRCISRSKAIVEIPCRPPSHALMVVLYAILIDTGPSRMQ